MMNRMKMMVLTGAAVTVMMSFAIPAVALPYTAGDSPAQTRTDTSPPARIPSVLPKPVALWPDQLGGGGRSVALPLLR